MPIATDDRGFLFWPDAWGAPALGLQTDNLEACIAEVLARKLNGVFGRHPEFKETDLSCLEATPDLTSAAFWDISLSDISTIYCLSKLRFFRISGKRPPINFAKLRSVENLVVEHNRRDTGFSELSNLKMMNLRRFKPPVTDEFEFGLPERLEEVGIFWSNVEAWKASVFVQTCTS